MSFHEKQIGDIVTFQRGFDITHAQRKEGGVPIVSSSGITGYHNEFKVDRAGVIIGRKGTLGTVHYINQAHWPHDTTLWVKDFQGNDPKFIYYFLKLLGLENFDVGAANPTLNRNHVHKITVKIPTKKIQKKIAAILTTYDELIETNNQRIQLLEKMAEEIYKESFVRLRFPGHETVKVVKGVPEGWEVVTLGDQANVTMGQSPSSQYYNEKKVGLPFHQGVGTYGKRYPITKVYCSIDGRKALKGDILFSVRAPVGRLNIADQDLIIGRGLSAINHKDGFNAYLYSLLKISFSNEDLIGNGAIFNAVSKKELLDFKVFCPQRDLIETFESIVNPISKQVDYLFQQNSNLAETRDKLLPRLISGKLSVENLDINFPPSMEDALA